MIDIYTKFVDAGYTEDEASTRVDTLVREIGEDSTRVLCTQYNAVFNSDTWCVDIVSVDTGEVVNSISEYVGELNHYGSSVSILYSLVYESMMDVDAILGR